MKLEARPNKFGDFYVYQLDEGPERVVARFTTQDEASHYIERKIRLAAKQAGIPKNIKATPAADDIPPARKKAKQA